MNSDIKKLLDKLDYRVVACATNNGCVVSFPNRKQEPLLMTSLISMQYTSEGVHVQHVDDTSVEIYSTTYRCPPYAQRLLLNFYIMYMCITIQYSLHYIKFTDSQDIEITEQEFFEAVNSPNITSGMIDKENILGQILMPCVAIGFNEKYKQLAKSNNVLDGFLAIQNALGGDNEK
jgi:hypothetical protein